MRGQHDHGARGQGQHRSRGNADQQGERNDGAEGGDTDPAEEQDRRCSDTGEQGVEHAEMPGEVRHGYAADARARADQGCDVEGPSD